MRKYSILALIVLAMIGSTSAYFVGVAPGINDIGEIDRGETREYEFYIQSDRDDIEVSTKVIRPPYQILRDGFAGDYGIEKDEYSAEPISSWVNFREPEYYDGGRQVETEDGNTLTVDGKINYFLEVPRDAEPGYHVGIVKMNPEITSGGATVNTRSVSDHVFVFRVPGEAEREVEVENIRALRTGDSSVRVETEVQNTGSVTTRVVSSEGEILTDSGQNITDLEIGGEFIAPGQTKTFTSAWTDENDIRAGNYETRGQLNYITGQAFFSDSLSVTDYIQIEDSGNESGDQVIPGSGSGDSPPMMLIMIALVLSGSIMYAFDIDPLLIIMMLGVLAVSSVIWFTAIPTAMIGLVVILSAGLFYYGWM